MNTKLVAALACGVAFALGACSGDAPATSTTPSTPDPTGPGTDPTDPGTGTPDPDPDPDTLTEAEEFDEDLRDATDKLRIARLAVTTAVRDANAADTEMDRTDATKKLSDAERDLRAAAALMTALTAQARAEALSGDTYRRGQAEQAAIAAAQALAEDIPKLDAGRTRLVDTFAWYRQSLARYSLRNGEAVMPPGASLEGANVEIERIPRTRIRPGTESTVEANPAAFTSTTFKTVMYADGKEMFSVTGDEFKVEGYTRTDGLASADNHTYAGLKLTSDGIVIRTGGTLPSSVWHTQWHTDFTDMRRDITRHVNANNSSPPHGRNGWDLVLTFGEPQTMSVPVGEPSRDLQSSWTGNGDFYWRSIVPADPRQLETDGDYYNSGAFLQPDGYKDLGTYDVWLSNYVGVNMNLEPVAGTEATCADGSIGSSCPDDDEPYYLKYAAYGLFVYTADTQTFRDASNGHFGRIQTMHLGYSAFGSEDGRRTTDIGTPITSAKFHGQMLAHAYTGTQSIPDFRDSKLLRGDATFTVTIPSTGNGTIEGDLENFEEWTGSRWQGFTTDFSVDLRSTSITDAGSFSGSAVASSTARTADFPSRLPTGHSSYALSGGLNGGGSFMGSFYGPRDDSADLEVAGSWRVGTSGVSARWRIFGSFGAKQRPAATPGG